MSFSTEFRSLITNLVLILGTLFPFSRKSHFSSQKLSAFWPNLRFRILDAFLETRYVTSLLRNSHQYNPLRPHFWFRRVSDKSVPKSCRNISHHNTINLTVLSSDWSKFGWTSSDRKFYKLSNSVLGIKIALTLLFEEICIQILIKYIDDASFFNRFLQIWGEG